MSSPVDPGLSDHKPDGHESLYDFFPALVYVYDLGKKRLSYINRRVTESLGYSFEEVEGWNQDLGKLIFSEDLPLVQKEIEKFSDLQENSAHAYKCRLNRKEGDYMHFQVTGRVLRRDAKGKAESVLFTAQNIHEQIQSASQTRAFKELIDETENLLQFATWNFEVDTGKETWSNGVYLLLNLDKMENPPRITSEFFLDHVLPVDRKRIDSLYDLARERKQEFLSYEYTIETHDKVLKILRSNIRFHYVDGQLVRALGINLDVTEKTSMLNNLLNYREMVMEKETFLDQGSWELDIASGAMEWSDGMYNLFGYDPASDKGNLTISEEIYKKHLSKEDYEDGIAKRKDFLETDNTYVWQYRIRTVSGEIKNLETFGRVFRDVKGQPVKVMGTTRDVTKVFIYERELERKLAELKRSNKDLEDFAYVASHDMHEPLRKVHAFADRLKSKYGTNLGEEAKDYLDRIMFSAQNARMMIDGLMEFSKLSRNGFWFESVDLDALVAEVLNDLELKIEETNTKVEVHPLPAITAMRMQMKQLFTNVIFNSIKFRKSDVAPVIKIKAEKLSGVALEGYDLDPKKEYYKISISDNGIGFEQEYAETVFQMFQRLNSKSEYPGSGIGLALCKKITDNHQGVILANSSLGQGTTISFILPIHHE